MIYSDIMWSWNSWKRSWKGSRQTNSDRILQSQNVPWEVLIHPVIRFRGLTMVQNILRTKVKWTVEIGGIPTMTNLAGPWSLGALRPFHSFSALRCNHFGVSCEILGMYPVELPGKIGAWTGDNGQCEPRVLRVNAHLDGEPNGVSYGNIMWISPMVSGTWNHNFINYRLVCGSIPLQTMVNWDHDHWISQVGKAARNTTNQ